MGGEEGGKDRGSRSYPGPINQLGVESEDRSPLPPIYLGVIRQSTLISDLRVLAKTDQDLS